MVFEKDHTPFDETHKEKQNISLVERNFPKMTSCYTQAFWSSSPKDRDEYKIKIYQIKKNCIDPTQLEASRAWRTCSLRSQFSGGVKYQLKKPKIVIAPKMTLA